MQQQESGFSCRLFWFFYDRRWIEWNDVDYSPPFTHLNYIFVKAHILFKFFSRNFIYLQFNISFLDFFFVFSFKISESFGIRYFIVCSYVDYSTVSHIEDVWEANSLWHVTIVWTLIGVFNMPVRFDISTCLCETLYRVPSDVWNVIQKSSKTISKRNFAHQLIRTEKQIWGHHRKKRNRCQIKEEEEKQETVTIKHLVFVHFDYFQI